MILIQNVGFIEMRNESQLSRQKKWFYLHVPKAGGTTLNHVLDRKFRKSKQYNYSTLAPQKCIECIKKMSVHQKKNIDLIRGHFVYGFHTWFETEEPKYFTVLREPVQRVVSHYKYSAWKRNHYLFEQRQSKEISLEEYVTSISPEASNGAAKQIAGVYVNDNFGYGKNIKECNDQRLLYDMAIENIQKHFVMIGITEAFNKTIFLLSKLFGGWGNYYYYRMNQNIQRKEDNYQISDKERDCIVKHNWADIKLYDYCLNKFNIQILHYNEKLRNYQVENYFLKNLLEFHRKVNRLL
jgi:hypothetical protein